MTTATKTKPTKTREDELAEQVKEHQAQVTTLEYQAAQLDQVAAELDARAEAKVTDLNGSLTDLPKSIDDDRSLALLKRQRAVDLRTRAQAYAAKVGLQAIAAEHDQLRQERIAAEQLEAATKEAEALIAEIENRSAWLYRSLIAERAAERRVIEAVQLLTTLQSQHRLPIDIGRYTRLCGEAIGLAGQYVMWINRDPDQDLWRQTLPALEPLELPAELVAPASKASPVVDQRGKPFDPTLPKDHAIRTAAASTPALRNPDGTLAGGYVPEPFGGPRHAPVPRTEAAERAARKAVAAGIAEEDGADGTP
jgi:hypothetical protein